MDQLVLTRVYSNETRKKSIQNVLIEDAPPIAIEGVQYYYCGTVDAHKEIGDTLHRNKVLRAFTSMESTNTGEREFVERILIIG